MYDELVNRLRSIKDSWQTEEENLMLEAADAIEELIREVADEHNARLDAEERQRWIPVTERLPEIGEIVLAYVDDLCLIIRAKIVDAKDYHGERRIDWARVDPDPFFLSCYTITHWMPLPEPPKEET